MNRRWRLAKNSAANLARGSAAAVAALALPPVLVRHMGAEAFAVWALVLQVAAYIGYLDFGLQAAVGRYVAFATEIDDPEARDGIFSTAFVGLAAAALAGILLIVLAAAAAHRIFPSIPASMLGPMRWATVIVGISVALGLPASAFSGVFVGLQRYEIPALATGGAKVISALGLIVAAIEGRSLLTMAVIFAAVNTLSYLGQYEALRRILPDLKFRLALIRRKTIRELSGYCFSLSIWSFSMLLVNGFDLILVGRFQFSAVAPYAVAATLVTFLAGSQNAIFGVIMPHAATLQGRDDYGALGKLLLSSTRLGMLFLLLTGLPLIGFAPQILRLMIGSRLSHEGAPILIVLLVANIVRLIGAPYASILIGTGQQRLVTVSPVLEGICNLAASIVLGKIYGAIGVAYGTMLGAVVGLLAHITYNMKRTQSFIPVSRWLYLKESVGSPLLTAVPFLLFFGFLALRPGNLLYGVLALAVSLSMAGMLAGRAALSDLKLANDSRPRDASTVKSAHCL